jgi:hypothetical protein
VPERMLQVLNPRSDSSAFPNQVCESVWRGIAVIVPCVCGGRLERLR